MKDLRLAICSEWLAPYVTSVRAGQQDEVHSLEYVFKVGRDLGYKGVELAPHTLAHLEDSTQRRYNRGFGEYLTIFDLVNNTGIAEDIRGLATKYGLQVPALHWILSDPPVRGLTPPIFHKGLKALPHITSDDQQRREMASDYLKAIAKFAHEVGARVCVIGSPGQRNYVAEKRLLNEGEYAVAKQNAVNTLAGSGAIGMAYHTGVIFALEALAPFPDGETNFITTASEAIQFARQVNNHGLEIMFDTKAMQSEGRPVAETIRNAARLAQDADVKILHYHANVDRIRPGPDTDEKVKFAEVFRALQEIGYNGWVSVEPFDLSKPVTPEETEIDIRKLDAKTAADYLRACWEGVK
jgi:sugar phosphate isomerase/epimerase